MSDTNQTTQAQETGLSLNTDLGRELLQASIDDYVATLDKLSPECNTPDDQARLLKHMVEGKQLINLIESERKKITSELDALKQKWMNAQRKFQKPIQDAMAPFVAAVEQYNREQIRLRQQAEAMQQQATQQQIQQTGEADWLAPAVPVVARPKGVQMRWNYEVEDFSKVPDDFKMLNSGAVSRVCGPDASVPGIRFFKEPVTTIRA
ncbi:hypothetical protein BN8_03637 [Fibrisoma limi BUZ 3]|uniref:Uncharacterized protein n=1 Tax=Fibrisoma limi BUZ 3 TaxID=1185876 RepID=I2GKN9_9BACT|nr:hypothetical protein [Fibrisoma limi]CCH54465.1 hypothetical protein BN8_03637 [Fibrisoma limi BUZ 3]